MNNSYQDPVAAEKYIEFLESEDGKIQKEILSTAIFEQLKENPGSEILEVGCGTGWLSFELSKKFPHIFASDISPTLLNIARENSPSVTFMENDICKALPFPEKKFDVIILNMVLHDCVDQKSALENIYTQTKKNSTVIITIPNPYYAFPVGNWKHNVFSFIFRKTPELLVKPYNILSKEKRLFFWNKSIPAYFYPLSEQIQNITSTGFSLLRLLDINSAQDSKTYNLKYRLFRYPVFLLLVLKKTRE